jgi:hypothetical protein
MGRVLRPLRGDAAGDEFLHRLRGRDSDPDELYPRRRAACGLRKHDGVAHGVPRLDPGITDLALKFIFAFGFCFQLPVLLTLLGKAGLVTAEGLGNVRKWAVVGILTLAALITPPDVITQLILFTVVYGLYEISIQLVRLVERSRNRRLREEGILDEGEEF